MKSATISYPKKSNASPVQLHPVFVAFGTAEGVSAIEGRLLYMDNIPVGMAQTFQNPSATDPFWIIAFWDVPKTPADKTYTLEIWEPGGNQPLATLAGLAVKPPFSTGITFPLNDETVGSTFVAFGTTDQVGTLTGKLIKGTDPPITGTTMKNGTTWMVNFAVVPPGTYDLKVWINQDMRQSTDIHVSS